MVFFFRAFFLTLALLFSSSLFAAVEGAHHHYFALEGDFVLLRRSNSHGEPLVITPETPHEPSVTRMTSGNLVNNMHFDPAISAALKIFYGIRSTWELRYVGRFDWEGKITVSDPGNLSIPGPVAEETLDYMFADKAEGIYRSNLYTAELNYWRHATPRYTDHFSVSWLIGLRFFNIEEKLKLFFTSFDFTSLYQIKTKSRAFGLQMGFSLEYNPYWFLTWGGVVKAGALFNRGSQDTLFLDDDNTEILFAGNPSGSNFAYCAQVYPYIEWRPAKFFTFVLYYQVLYAGAVIVADSQLIFYQDSIDLSTNGDIVYHGLTAGIQFNF